MEERETLSVALHSRVVLSPSFIVEGLAVKEVMVGGVVSPDPPEDTVIVSESLLELPALSVALHSIVWSPSEKVPE